MHYIGDVEFSIAVGIAADTGTSYPHWKEKSQTQYHENDKANRSGFHIASSVKSILFRFRKTGKCVQHHLQVDVFIRLADTTRVPKFPEIAPPFAITNPLATVLI
jgi:hypothetical protein